MTVVMRWNLKIAPMYFQTFRIIRKVGQVAYKLEFPFEAKIYPIFHISCLKKKVGEWVQAYTSLPNLTPEGALEPELEKVLQRRLKKKGNMAKVEILV